jgi:acyl-CoA synthetase (AMP-forming)/AMP-acid ligase II
MLKNVKNLGKLLTDVALRIPDEPGLIIGDREYSWKEINRRVDAVATAFRDQLGLKKGDKLVVHSRNNLQIFESAWVAFKMGLVWAPTNVRMTPHEAAYIASSSGAVAMIYEAGADAHVDAAKAASPDLKHIVAIGKPRDGELSFDALADATTDAFEEAEVEYEDGMWFFYTSGTTGHPKAGTLTHGQMAFVITNHLADLMPGITYQSRSLVVAPLSHGAGIHAVVNAARGAANILPASDRFDAEDAWRLIEKHKVDNMFTVPTIVKMLVEHESVDRYDHSSLKFVIYAGAPMYRADQKYALKKLGKVLVQYYGLGEVTGNITVLPPWMHHEEDTPDARVGTCGYARTGIDIAILNPAGDKLQPFETGEICVRGPAVMEGYFNNPSANEKAFKGGWFHTGDLGHLDAQGFLFITGRESDMYISGGSNVYPREIEEALLLHASVSEVAVLGVPDPKWGESGVAVIVCKPGCSVTNEELLAFIGDRVAKYKWPRYFVYWDTMPKSGYGKIVKKQIRGILEEQGTLANA